MTSASSSTTTTTRASRCKSPAFLTRTRHKIKGEEKRISAFSFFNNRIDPKWEDPVNEQGGEFRVEFKAPIAVVQKVWEKFVFQVVSGEFAEIDSLCGFRMLDKSKETRENQFRLEVWIKQANDSDEIAQKIDQYLTANYIDFIIAEVGKDGEDAKIQRKFSSHGKTKK